MLSVAIGFFDGVHLGHQKILKGADVAVTFRNHPLTLLNAAKAPRLIMSFDDRVAAIRSCGVREVLALDFTAELANRSPGEFLSTLNLNLQSQPFALRCGANWRFGKNAAGTPEWLRAHGIAVEVVEAAEYEGAQISSTRIRECLSRGEIAAANAMMGRRLKVEGRKLKGKGEGVKLGYPTINLSLRNCSPFAIHCSMPLGVYQVEVNGCPAIANYGFAPTFGDRAWKEPVLEVHVLKSESRFSTSTFNLQPEIPVEFIKYIRPERKFASVEDLKTQIAADIAEMEQGI